MDEFFQLYPSPESMIWFEEAPMPNKSAFLGYTRQPFKGLAYHQNANKRMIEFLKKTRVAPVAIESIEKHKISERMRRQKHKENFLALHKLLLPLGVKGDKISILEKAAKEIGELKQYKEELMRQNREMEMILAARENEKAVEKAEIKLKVAYPASGVDSMLEVLRCLKDTDSKATSIQSYFSEHEFAAALEVETKIRAADVEKAVQTTLFEAESKFREQLQERQWKKLLDDN